MLDCTVPIFARQAGLESGQSTQVGGTKRESTVSLITSPLHPGLTVDLDFDKRSLCTRLYQQWGRGVQWKLRVFGSKGY